MLAVFKKIIGGNNMIVCEHCLKEIKSREGEQFTKKYEYDIDGGNVNENKEEVKCEFCDDFVEFSQAKVIL